MLTTTLLAVQSCSSMDDDDSVPLDNKNGSFEEMLSKNLIVLPGDKDPMTGLDSLNRDTLKIFPDDVLFHKMLMQCMVSSQSMVRIIASSIDATVLGNGSAAWLDYYSSYLGVYSSVNDSRSKQWNLEQYVLYGGTTWDYHLSILDLPEGVATDNRGTNAVEVFYDTDFNRGIMIFSPTDFDAVGFPKKVFGPDIMGILTFSNDGVTTTNELYLTNIGVNNSVNYIRNVYLHTELTNNCVAIKTMIDFPTLWFDTKDNNGFTVSAVGACDVSTGGAVIYSGIVRNSSSERTVSSLVVEHPSADVLNFYYPLWQEMIEASSSNENGSNEDGENEGGNDDPSSTEENGEDADVTSEPEGKSLKLISSNLSEMSPVENYETVYGKPGYYKDGDYKPVASVTEKSAYLKSLNKCLDLMDGDFPITPYKNSVNQVEWSSVEKSR